MVGGLWLSLFAALHSHSLLVPFGDDTSPPGQRGTLRLVARGCGVVVAIVRLTASPLACAGGHARAWSLSPFVVLIATTVPAELVHRRVVHTVYASRCCHDLDAVVAFTALANPATLLLIG